MRKASRPDIQIGDVWQYRSSGSIWRITNIGKKYCRLEHTTGRYGPCEEYDISNFHHNWTLISREKENQFDKLYLRLK